MPGNYGGSYNGAQNLQFNFDQTAGNNTYFANPSLNASYSAPSGNANTGSYNSGSTATSGRGKPVNSGATSAAPSASIAAKPAPTNIKVGSNDALLDGIQSALDYASFIPGLNTVTSGINAAIYAYRGDYSSMAMSIAGMVPGLGQVAMTAKIARKVGGVTKGLAGVPGRVQSRINVSNEGWAHVLKRHFSGKPNASQFSVGQSELKSLLQSKQVVGSPVTRTIESADGLRYVREIDMGRAIGVDAMNGNAATSVMTTMSDKFGNLITAFPGVLK
jgi:hypothetical protein